MSLTLVMIKPLLLRLKKWLFVTRQNGIFSVPGEI